KPRTHPLQGARHHFASSGRSGAAWARSLVPNLSCFPAPDGARKCAGGAAATTPILVRLLAVEACAQCIQRTGDGPHCRRRTVVIRLSDGGGIAIRPQTCPGDRYHLGARAGNAAAGRTNGW